MAKRTLAEIKALFETGDKPTGQDFIDMIDTLEDATLINADMVAITAALATKVDISDLRSGAFTSITKSTDPPSGGVDGDVWIQYTA